jgi:hypothetical protein
MSPKIALGAILKSMPAVWSFAATKGSFGATLIRTLFMLANASWSVCAVYRRSLPRGARD